MNSFPTPFMRALAKDDYDSGDSDFTVTQIIGRPLRSFLALSNEPQSSPYSNLKALIGTAIHAVLEANIDFSIGERGEERIYKNVLGSKIGCKFDFCDPSVRTLYDYKTHNNVIDEPKPEHIKQVQMNGAIANHNGIVVDYVAIVYIQLDWSLMQSQANPSYPQSPFKIFAYTHEQKYADNLLLVLTKEHQDAVAGSPRPCTMDEQWAKPDQWALKKIGAKRATKIYDIKEDAIAAMKAGHVIERRPASKTFCENFCGFAHCCPQFKKEKEIQ
jgi:hypothetical protein